MMKKTVLLFIILSSMLTLYADSSVLVRDDDPTIGFDDSNYSGNAALQWIWNSEINSDGSIRQLLWQDRVSGTGGWWPMILQGGYIGWRSIIGDSNGDMHFANNALTVKRDGNVGIGTSSPLSDLHIADLDWPSIRLNERGYTAYTLSLGWDSGSGFFISDGVHYPFKIYDGSPRNSLVISQYGVGINTNAPSATFDVEGDAVINGELNTTKAITASFSGSTTKAALKMMDISVNNTDNSQKSDVGFAMTNARENFTWSFRTWEPDSGFAIAKYGNGGTKEFRLHDTDPADAATVVLTLANGASCNGTWNDASSRSLKQDIKPLGNEEALEAFSKLQPVTYAYKANPTDPKVGFIAEDVPDLVANEGRKSLSAMDMVALLTKVVQVQKEALDAQNERIQQKEIVLQETISEVKEKAVAIKEIENANAKINEDIRRLTERETNIDSMEVPLPHPVN